MDIFNKHFIRVDASKNIIHGFSDAFENPIETDILINDNGGIHFQLIVDGEPTQENPPLHDEYGTPLYNWDGNQVTRRTNEEIEADRPEPDNTPSIHQVQARFFAASLGADIELTPEETHVISRAADLSPIADGQEWRPGLNLAEGTIVTRNGQNFIVIQPHISQASWPPNTTPALFSRIREQYVAWTQPQGTHDAYMMGDRVLHNGQVWASVADFNVWEPGVHGWELAE